MVTKTTQRTEQDLLGVYLNDHLAGATVGLQLVRRMAASAEPGSSRPRSGKGWSARSRQTGLPSSRS